MNRPKNKKGFYNQICEISDVINSEKRKEIKIPVELCFYVVKNKLLPVLKVFILLKMTSSGKCKLSNRQIMIFSEFCGYKTMRSFKNQLKRLLKLNWIGLNKQTGVYHIRSFGNIQRQYQMQTRTGFWFSLKDMQCFDGVIYGAIIGYLSKSQGKKQRTDPQCGGSNQILCKSPGFYPIANWALAKILNISISTASNMKRRAEEEECITIKRKRILEPATPAVYKRLSTSYPVKYFNPITLNHKFYQRLPDLVKAEMKYGMRKKNDK